MKTSLSRGTPLTPLAGIPASELAVWENQELRASLLCGLAEAAKGQTRRLDWVTADINLDEDAAAARYCS